MSKFYVCCHLGAENGCVTLGTLHRDRLTLGEVRRFENVPLEDKDSQWNIADLYQQTVGGLQEVGRYDEPIDSISCTSWADDYLLFDSCGSLITPAYRHDGVNFGDGRAQVLSKIDWESIYGETGVSQKPGNTLFQLGGENSRRLRKASHLLPVGDAFNFLFTGVPRIEMSQASAMQLYNPVSGCWSPRLLNALKLTPDLLPPVIPAGTELGVLNPQMVKDTGLRDARVVASCSHQLAAALAGLPVAEGEQWGFLNFGAFTTMGTQLVRPLINRASREMDFTNELGYAGSVRFSKRMVGTWLLDECRRHWKQHDRELDADVLMHLAACSEPFESLVNPCDPAFLGAGDMPSKIQEFCARTGQTVPRKPGPIFRCIMESLALQYRKTLQEIEQLTGRKLSRVHLLGNTSNSLLNHFTANALEIPLVTLNADTTAIGSVMVQAMTMGHVRSMEHAREITRNSFKTETINPHAKLWSAAYNRFAELGSSESAAILLHA
jgi:rhamnulokinase